MGRRRRPRRHERRAASAEAHRAAAGWALRRARRSLVGTVVTWVVTVAAAAVLVTASGTSRFVLGILGPSRTGAGPLELEVTAAGALALTVTLMAAPVALTAAGLGVTGHHAEAARQDGPGPLSAWTDAGLGAALALAPNLLGSLAASSWAPRSDVLLIAQAWPLAAVAITFVAADAAAGRLGAIRSGRAAGETP